MDQVEFLDHRKNHLLLRPKAWYHFFLRASILIATLGFLGMSFDFYDTRIRNEKHRFLMDIQQSPALRLHFKTQRSSMAVHGYSEFDVFAVPQSVHNTAIRFNGIATFIKQDISHRYSLVDGMAFYSFGSTSSSEFKEAKCLDASVVPPIDMILQAINDGQVVTKVTFPDDATTSPLCDMKSKKLQVSFMDETFVFCRMNTTSSIEKGFRIIGQDIQIDVTYLSDPIIVTKPSSIKQEELVKCTQVKDSSKISPSTWNLLSGSNSKDWLNAVKVNLFHDNYEQEMTIQSASCGCKSGNKRPCLFFHGVGNPIDGGLKDTNPSFGEIQKHAPCCSTVKFASLNTVQFAWNDAILQSKVCNASLSMSPSSTNNTIKDTIIVTHSMANLMFSGALANNRCTIDPTTSTWISLSGPMRGSMGSDFQQDVCDGGSFSQEAIKAVISLFGQCPSSPANRQMAYDGGNFASKTLQAEYSLAREAHKKYTYAMICGDDFFGLFSKDQYLGILGGRFLPHKTNMNDGLVEFESCRGNFDSSVFQENFDSKFYRAKLNHADTQMRHGDALFGNTQKPIKWFECLL
jgi:hypothetical protein